MIWDNGLFWNRLPLKFKHILEWEDSISFNDNFKEKFINQWGNKYGWVILNKYPLPDELAEEITNAFKDKNNTLIKNT